MTVKPHNESGPVSARNQAVNQNTLNRHYNTSPLNLLLSRLENVKPAGEGYRACCPAHDSQSRNTLTIKQADDGRVLLHDFGGCTALDVVHSLGLELKDLFERPIAANMTAEEKRQLRQQAKQSQWKAALEYLPLEIYVIEIAAGAIAKGKPLDEVDHQRLILAGTRIRSAGVTLCGR